MIPLKDHTHVVIDLETLDTVPTAVVLSIGIAVGNLQEDLPKNYHWNLCVPSQIFAGRSLSQSTVEWWREKDLSLQLAAIEYPVAVTVALYEVQKTLNDLKKAAGEDSFSIWGNSPSFDLGILSNLFAQYKFEVPWKYWQERDLRTYGAMVGVSFNEWKQQQENSFVAHCAKEDAMAELKYIFTYLPSSAGE